MIIPSIFSAPFHACWFIEVTVREFDAPRRTEASQISAFDGKIG
jgi:hypothetical protein